MLEQNVQAPPPPLNAAIDSAAPDDAGLRMAAEDALRRAYDARDRLRAAVRAGVSGVAEARAALSDLQGIAIPTGSVMAGAVSDAVAQGMALAGSIPAMESEDGVVADNDDTPQVSTGRSRFANRKVQELILKNAPELQSFINEKLNESSYEAMKVTTDSKGVVQLQKAPDLTGDQVREALTHAHFHSLDEKERGALAGQINQTGGPKVDSALDKKEAKALKSSLETLEQFRANKIMQGPGTEEEKAAKLQLMHERFERARANVNEAQKAEENVVQKAPEALRPSLRQFGHQKLQESLKKDVIEGEIMESSGAKRERSQGINVTEAGRPSLTPIGDKRREAETGRG
jgi:hypothetical protein